MWNASLHAALRVHGVAQLLGQQQRRHAGDVGLPGEHLEVEHQLDVLIDFLRRADGRIRQRQLRRRLLRRLLDAALDLADVVEVLIDAVAVARRQPPLKGGRFSQHRIEQAHGLLPSRAPLGIGAAVAEQPLEHDLRIVLHRQRRGRSLPRNRVAVRATEIAAAQARVLDHQLDRGQRRVLSDVLRRELVHA